MKKYDNELPPKAKRVFKGQIFEVWQWDQEMYDGSTAIFEELKRPDTAVVIATVGNQIIIQDQEQPNKPPFISFPGGRVDDGEAPLEAAKRELLEETGYESNNWEIWFTQCPLGKMVWTIYYYVAHNCQLTQKPHLDNGEKIENKLISFDEFLMLSENPKFRGRELNEKLLRARFIPEEKEKLKELLFG